MMNAALFASLDIMWKGMAGIFVVMVILMACIKLLSVLTKNKKD